VTFAEDPPARPPSDAGDSPFVLESEITIELRTSRPARMLRGCVLAVGYSSTSPRSRTQRRCNMHGLRGGCLTPCMP
jgi:hypothetical protein